MATATRPARPRPALSANWLDALLVLAVFLAAAAPTPAVELFLAAEVVEVLLTEGAMETVAVLMTVDGRIEAVLARQFMFSNVYTAKAS